MSVPPSFRSIKIKSHVLFYTLLRWISYAQSSTDPSCCGLLIPLGSALVAMSLLGVLATSNLIKARDDDLFNGLEAIVNVSVGDRCPGYTVLFRRTDYSLGDHFKKIRREITDMWTLMPYGYAANLTAEDVFAVKMDPNVMFVEPCVMFDVAWEAKADNATDTPAADSSLHGRDDVEPQGREANAGWALSYLSQQGRNPPNEYVFVDDAGIGVDVYVIDSGIKEIPPSKDA